MISFDLPWRRGVDINIPMNKHISLDFWNTVGIPNPEFAEARNRYLAICFNVTKECAAVQYSMVKRYLDYGAEELGIGLSSTTCWEMLTSQFGRRYAATQAESHVRHLFRRYPPTILPETIEQMKLLEKAGVTFSIGSNVNFISSYVIKDMLRAKGAPFLFFAFSDDLGVSKPSKNFFDIIKRQVEGKEIIHIGDSDVFDCQGARQSGITPVFLASPELLPQVLGAIAL